MVVDAVSYSDGIDIGGHSVAHPYYSSSRFHNRKFSVDSAIAVSWESDDSSGDGEGQGGDEPREGKKNDGDLTKCSSSIEEIDEDETRRHLGTLTVGFDDAHRRASAPEYVCDTGGRGQRKLQSILRAQPQVFKVYEKTQSKKKNKSKSSKSNTEPQSPESSSPQRRVGFNLPQGVKIPERVSIKTPGRVPVPIFRAKKTLGALKQKLTGGENPSEAIPWRPSPHVIPMQHQTKFKRSRKISPPSSTIPILKKLTELKLKNVEELDEFTKLNEFQAYLEKEREADPQYDSQSENENDEVESEDEFESENDSYEDTEGLISSVENVNKEEEEEDRPKLSRRKALGYHLKTINIQNNTDNNSNSNINSKNNKKPLPSTPAPVRKHSRKAPSFPTGGHGLGHADRNHNLHKSSKCHRHGTSNCQPGPEKCPCPKEPCQECPEDRNSETDVVGAVGEALKKMSSNDKKRLPFNYFNKKFKIMSSTASSDNDSSSKEDSDMRSAPSSRANSVQMNENEILLNLVSQQGKGQGQELGDDPPSRSGSFGQTILINGKPVKIVNARYRRVPSFDLFPFVCTD